MSKRAFGVVAVLMLVVAAAVRVNNALVFLPLHSYDGFGHFTYIWYMSKTWHVPLPTSGWSFFHPPLYYWFMAALWNALVGVDPIMRLKIGGLILGVLSLTHAVVAYLIVRRYFPEQRVIQLSAIALPLFIPVMVYSAPFLGNEGLGGILSSISLLALLTALRRPTVGRSVVLGICIGLSMLAKFTGLAVLSGACVALSLQALRSREVKTGAINLAVMGAVVLAISGWFYGRNYWIYGNPFKMSRDEFMVQHVEHIQTKGNRGLLEYLTFDPLILYRPVFPRGLPLTGNVPRGAVRSAIREGVWTGMYANTWFDGFGDWVIPSVFGNELSRRSGQILLTLGVLPTLTMILGAFVAVWRLWRDGWDETLVAMVATFLTMLAIFVHGTRIAPLHAAVKATYFVPIVVVFSFWFALGLSSLRKLGGRWVQLVTLDFAAAAMVSTLVFTQGLLNDPNFFERPKIGRTQWANLKGVVYYAGGDRETAARLFQISAANGWHLAYENLATLALEDGRPLEALYLLRTAASLEPRQSFGLPADRRHFIRITQADYYNSMAVIYSQLGWYEEAIRAAESAEHLDPSMAEAFYNGGVLRLLLAARGGATGPEEREVMIRQARTLLYRSVLVEPNLLAGAGMLGVSRALLGDCAGAAPNFARALDFRGQAYEEYPVETGRGIAHSAAIGRRKRIHGIPDTLRPEYWRHQCEETGEPAKIAKH